MILNLILMTLRRIHGRIVINVCVKYREEMLIGVGDIHPDGQHFQIFCRLVAHYEFDPDETSQDT